MKKYILISPWSKMLRDNSYNPKNYPHWKEVVRDLVNSYDIVQVGVDGEEQLVHDFRIDLYLSEVAELIVKSYLWISVDNFLPHLAHLLKKQGIVLWGESDPLIFGYPENLNLLKSRDYLRKDQFGIWDGRKHRPEIFVDPEVVIKAVRG